MNWSDGDDFTMEDVRFVWEDVNFNPEINKVINPFYRDPVTDNPVKFAVLDDLKWTMTFDTPVYTVFSGKKGRGMTCSGRRDFCWFGPSHYLKQFHPKYADPTFLQNKINEFGVSDWNNLWIIIAAVDLPGAGHGLPCTTAWCMEGTHTDTQGTLSRNHFNHQVDPEGNQLPYADGLTMIRTESREVAIFRSMAGETDAYSTMSQLQEVPLYIQNMVKGDYSIRHWPTPGGADGGISFNQTWNDDPEIGRWIRTKDFRRALSLGMDRDEINQTVFLGVAVPQNWVPHPSTLWYPGPEWATLDIEHDPAKANGILDGLGLTKKDSSGFRMRLDGKGVIELRAVFNPDEAADIGALLQDQWTDIGIKFTFRTQNSAHVPIRNNVEYMGISIDLSAYQANPWAVTWTSLAPLTKSTHHATLIGEWYVSGGTSGMAPSGPDPAYLPLSPAGKSFPADATGNLMRANELWQQGRGFPKLDPERIRIGKEIFKIMAEEKYFINTVAFSGTRRGVVFQRNNFRNVPVTHTRDQFGFWRETYYFEEGIDNFSHDGNRSRKYKSVAFLGGS
jgi:peptide/nickel transport system substrate-binding protein